MSYMLLLDVVGALHLNTSNEFCTNELFFKMPKSDHNLGEIYNQFLVDEKLLPPDVVEDDDALLILLALCSDVMTTQRTYEESRRTSLDDPKALQNPAGSPGRMPSHLLPFSSGFEYQRVISQLQRALDRWSERFKESVPEGIRALYHFVTLCSFWSTTLLLPRFSGYAAATISATPTMDRTLSATGPPDEALRHAWLVLDNVNVRGLNSPKACPIWLPVVTYMSSLVVWKSLQHPSATRGNIGSSKVLGMFKAELEQMFWPCCSEMARHLDSLMHQ